MAGLESKIKSLFLQNLGNSITPNQQLILNELLIQINQMIDRSPVSPLPEGMLECVRNKRIGVTTLLAITAVALWEMYPSIYITLSSSSHGTSVVMSKMIQKWMSSEFNVDEYMNLYAPSKHIVFDVGVPEWFPIICLLGDKENE